MHHFLLGFHNSDVVVEEVHWDVSCFPFKVQRTHSSLSKLLLLLRTRKVHLPSLAQEFPSSWDTAVCTALVAINAGLGGGEKIHVGIS